MVKKWIDAGLIADREDIPKELYKYDNLMKEKPNWNKNKKIKNIKKKEGKSRIK